MKTMIGLIWQSYGKKARNPNLIDKFLDGKLFSLCLEHPFIVDALITAELGASATSHVLVELPDFVLVINFDVSIISYFKIWHKDNSSHPDTLTGR